MTGMVEFSIDVETSVCLDRILLGQMFDILSLYYGGDNEDSRFYRPLLFATIQCLGAITRSPRTLRRYIHILQIWLLCRGPRLIYDTPNGATQEVWAF